MNGWFDSPIESFKAAYNDGIAKWHDALAALDAAYAEFQANYDYAISDDELSQEWQALNDKVSLLQATIQNVESAITTVTDFIASIGQTIGLSGRQTLQGMGVLPAIPWAVVGLVTAGVAGVWLIVNQLKSFNTAVTNKKIAEQNIVNAQEGKPLIPYLPEESSGPGGFMSGLSGTTKWVVIGVLGFLALDMAKKGKR